MERGKEGRRGGRTEGTRGGMKERLRAGAQRWGAAEKRGDGGREGGMEGWWRERRGERRDLRVGD